MCSVTHTTVQEEVSEASASESVDHTRRAPHRSQYLSCSHSLFAAEVEIKSLRKRLKIKVLGDECADPVITWEEFYNKYRILLCALADHRL